jgi:hypothetical protein
MIPFSGHKKIFCKNAGGNKMISPAIRPLLKTAIKQDISIGLQKHASG